MVREIDGNLGCPDYVNNVLSALRNSRAVGLLPLCRYIRRRHRESPGIALGADAEVGSLAGGQTQSFVVRGVGHSLPIRDKHCL